MRLYIYLFCVTIAITGCSLRQSKREASTGIPATQTRQNIPITKTYEIDDEQESLEPKCASSILAQFPLGQMPPFLGYVVPEPDSCYTVAAYEELASLSSLHEFMGPGICFSIDPFPLMEPGDFPTTEAFLLRIRMIIDENLISHYRSATEEGFVYEHRDIETNELLWRIPEGAESQVCFEVALDPGDHVATIIFERTSGKMEQFTWLFTLK